VGLGTESLIERLLGAPENVEVMDLPISDHERASLASILMKDDEELTAEKIEGAVRALRRMQVRRRLQDVQRQLETMRTPDPSKIQALMDEKLRLKRVLMNPALGADEITAASAD